jgi:uncharacterized DUF497 family protein
MSFNFEWHEAKAKINLQKHGVSFDEAVSIFADPFSITIVDSEHSTNEERYIDIGMSDKNQLLVVVYTERNENIRLISCRKANSIERQCYESNL